jgi:hypothetical protein
LDELFCDPDCPPLDAGGEQPEAPPILPFLPDEKAIIPCEECVEPACEEARSSCLEDTGCLEVFDCLAPCDNPKCIRQCWDGGLDNSGPRLGTASGWDLYNELRDCALTQCPTQCQATQNWECVGNFDWPTANSHSIDVSVRFAPNGTGGESKLQLAGAMARACSFIDCTHSDWVRLDERNAADFKLPTNDRGPLFTGHFELESEEIGPVGIHHRIHYWPLWAGQDLYMGVVPDYVNLLVGWRPSPSSAALWVFANDCLHTSATRLRLQLRDLPDIAVGHIANDVVSWEATETSAGAAFFPEVPIIEGEVRKVVVQALLRTDAVGEGKVVVEREVALRAGWVSTVYLAPSSRTGL